MTENLTVYAIWEINFYTITFDSNGGILEDNEKSLPYDSELGELPTPERTGYTFNNWWTSAEGGTQISSATRVADNDATYYAHWTINPYTVICEDWFVDGNNNLITKLGEYSKESNYGVTVYGGEWGDDSSISAYHQYYKYVSCTSATVTTSGATVYRYFYGYNIIKVLDPDGNDSLDGSVAKFSISYDGGEYLTNQMYGAPAYAVIPYGAEVKIKDIDMQEDYYELDNVTWSGDELTPINEVYTITYNTVGKALYINTKYKEYEITYNLTGGTNNANNPSTYTYDESVTLYEPTKSGAEFFGWNCSIGSNLITGTPTLVNSGVTINNGIYTIQNPNPTGNIYNYSKIQLYNNSDSPYAYRSFFNTGIQEGVYKHNLPSGTYGVRFGLNGYGVVTGGGRDGCVMYNVNLQQGKCYYYKFNIESFTEQGGVIKDVIFVEITQNKNVTIPQGSTGNKVFKAYWLQNILVKSTITYNLYGGTNHSENPTMYTAEDTITLKAPTKSGKSFFGWNCTEGSNLLASYNQTYTITNSTSGNNFNCTKWQISQSGNFLSQPSTGWSTGKWCGVYHHTLASGTYRIRLAANGNKADGTAYYADVTFTQGKYYYYEFNISSFSPQSITITSSKLCEVTANTNVTIPVGSIGNKSFTAYWLDN